jgi:hypothetical protein
VLNGTFDKLISILNDVPHHKDWVYNNQQAYILKKISSYEYYYYSETYLPWPLSNRDEVAHVKINVDSLNHFLEVTETGEPNFIPEKNGIVRVPKCKINWHVTMPSTNTLHIVYTIDVEPGGTVPAWLVNTFADKGPYQSFKKLSELLRD